MSIPAMEKVALAREYRVASWFREGIEALTKNAQTMSVQEMATLLDWETTARIFAIRDSNLSAASAEVLQASQLVCIGCGNSPSKPALPYPVCCSGSQIHSRYGIISVQGYSLRPLPVVPLAEKASEAIKHSIEDLFGEELRALEQY
jgi:hypothetical protein